MIRVGFALKWIFSSQTPSHGIRWTPPSQNTNFIHPLHRQSNPIFSDLDLANFYRNSFPSAMPQAFPTIIPGLRSPSQQINGLVYFCRMLDKIRLRDSLPEQWREMRGAPSPNTFDARCCRFLRIDYAAIE